MQLDLFREIIVDNFAGGGGASTGIEMATGLSVDIAINHDPDAITMHKTNHPETEHFCESVWDVDPVKAVKGRKVGLAWFSPDCKYFSKAKGGKPVDSKIRGLAWIAIKWAIAVRPRVIILENVEEFQSWGPLINGYPDPTQKGRTFKSFIKAFEALNYTVEFKELRASDYGAPTIRKRLFMVARCDGCPIVWPSPTHGNPRSTQVKKGLLKPWVPSANIIDWSLEAPSIFRRNKPLSPNTLARIDKGIQKFIIDEKDPYISPLQSMTTSFITSYYSETSESAVRGLKLTEPLHTITAGGNRFGLVSAFLTKSYGSNTGQSLKEPLHTVTTKDRFGLVTIKGEDYKITDIGMRMLQPHELFSGQGFPPSYIIEKDYTGKSYSKSKQVARCGNAVPPPFAEALVRANLPEYCVENTRYRPAIAN